MAEAKFRLETYGLDGSVPFAAWHAALAETIWPKSRFAVKPPELGAECPYGECKGYGKPRDVPNDKPLNKKKMKNPEKRMCARCGLKYCSVECRKKCRNMHDMVCEGDKDPREMDLFIITNINHMGYQQIASYANDIFLAALATIGETPLLKPGSEPFELERSEGQTQEDFEQNVHIAFVERARHALGKQRLAQSMRGAEVAPPEELLPPTTSMFAGANLFLLIALATAGRNTVLSLTVLFSNLINYLVHGPPSCGFNFYTLETGHIAPGMLASERGGPSFKDVFLSDMQLKPHMSAAYLIVLANRDGTVMLTTLLWRTGTVSRLFHALPGHYSLGEWLCQDEEKVDKPGYAAKYMSTETVTKMYVGDLMMLTDAKARPSKRREAFCNAFGLHSKNLVTKHVGGEGDVLPDFSLSVCRVFIF